MAAIARLPGLSESIGLLQIPVATGNAPRKRPSHREDEDEALGSDAPPHRRPVERIEMRALRARPFGARAAERNRPMKRSPVRRSRDKGNQTRADAEAPAARSRRSAAGCRRTLRVDSASAAEEAVDEGARAGPRRNGSAETWKRAGSPSRRRPSKLITRGRRARSDDA